MGVRVTLEAAAKSPTNDEFFHHIANGATYWVTKDFRMNPASPPLPRMAAALPLLMRGAKVPLYHPSWEEGDSPEFARQFFNVANEGRLDELIFWARIPTMLLSLFFGWMVFAWARGLFGNNAALISLTLYAFCPDILAHAGLATSDLWVGAFFFVSLYAYWFFMQRPSSGRAAGTGFAMGLALLSKFSAVLLFPILPLVAWLSGRGRELTFKRTALFLGVSLLTVWTCYFFEVKPLLKNTPDPAKKELFLKDLGGEKLAKIGRETPLPLTTFVASVGSLAFTREKGTHAFLLGQWSDNGWWYYYLVAFLLKNTIPFLLFCVLSVILAQRYLPDRLATAILWLPVVFFFAVTLRDKAQAGIRYFLPIYPLLFVACGGAGAYLLKARAGKILVAALLLCHAGEALAVHPHYLSYFNEAAGGSSNGYRSLRDSNVDWGQDLKGLARLAQKKGYGEIALYFYGPSDPSWYKMHYRMLEDSEFETPKQAVYAIGAHQIDAVRWTARFKPDEIVGHSVFVYDFTQKALP